MDFAATDLTATTADYRRRARRIRASFAKSPLLRQRALVDLAAERNSQTQVARQKTAARRVAPVARPSAINEIEHAFADEAATRLQPFGFTFSDRVMLLDLAERKGIVRFRANMILALLEHQTSSRRICTVEVPSKSVAPSLLVILGIELAVVGVLVMLVAL